MLLIGDYFSKYPKGSAWHSDTLGFQVEVDMFKFLWTIYTHNELRCSTGVVASGSLSLVIDSTFYPCVCSVGY